ncbi:Asparagine synthase [uncultured Defluviicoccus sp.]|uniref:Asparagine synthase n=1 Tax=metagenome TaxID=256318 RepID=A0A380TKD7_9ZZZZ|nr:Asparagine synthase [uncultured Defluviicoccus sp.]
MAAPVGKTEVLAIRDAMRLRGPDGEGLWLSADGRVGLAHRRLAILDLSDAGAQPMRLDGDPQAPIITFNGEIYNYRELRARLEAQGSRFRSTSDTEVLLHLYRRDGAAMVERLRGMYAFVIWDPARRQLFAARDPFGIKPLYYADDGRTIRLASQVKALLAGGGIDTTPEPAGHAGFFLFGHVPEPFTLYRGIRSLPAGGVLIIDDGGQASERQAIDIIDALVAAEANAGAAPTADAAIAAALADSVRAHLVADVDVGAFLSAGKDSTTIVALAARGGQKLNTLTLGFAEFAGTANDEIPLAEAVAARFSARHRTVNISREDFLADRDRLLAAMDQPTIDGVNTYFVARAAAQAGMKVALSGLGGDEVFAGYSNFTRIPRIVSAVGWLTRWPALGVAVRQATRHIATRFGNRKYASLIEYAGDHAQAYLLCRALYLPWELPQVLDAEFAREGLERLAVFDRLRAIEGRLSSARAKVTALEMSFYMRNQLLRDADWAGMAHSLEIRVPLVDTVLLKTLAPRIVGREPFSKDDMVETIRADLPATLLNRAKSGFMVPVAAWIGGGEPSRFDHRAWARRVMDGTAGASLCTQ